MTTLARTQNSVRRFDSPTLAEPNRRRFEIVQIDITNPPTTNNEQIGTIVHW